MWGWTLMELSNVFTSHRQGLNTAKLLKPCLDAGKLHTLRSTKGYVCTL